MSSPKNLFSYPRYRPEYTTPAPFLPMSRAEMDALGWDSCDVILVTGDAVQQGKPHPEPYLKAAALLGVSPADAVAIEDSNTGARSAEAAGALVLVVPNHVPVLEGERRVFRATLAGLTPADLGRLGTSDRRSPGG